MRRLVLGFLLVVLSIGLPACTPLQSLSLSQPTAATPHGKIDPPRTMPEFTLTDQDGKLARLSDFRGRAVLLFFGYTHCPDVCPLTMAQMKAVKNALGSDASQVAFVMISVDGTRDTPEVMKHFVKSFDPGFIGLTGNEASVQQIAKNYYAEFSRQESQDTHGDSVIVGHTGYLYLLDRQSRWRFIYTSQTPAETIVLDIKQILSE
ncbi:MAG: SCO family protein [Chloroflexi bacterium]|nr:SCO family protein [Chloroflexota bacterium]